MKYILCFTGSSKLIIMIKKCDLLTLESTVIPLISSSWCIIHHFDHKLKSVNCNVIILTGDDCCRHDILTFKDKLYFIF